MKNRRCGNCGSIETEEKAYIGPFPWKDYPQLFLTKSIPIVQCKICGETMGGLDDSRKLDQAAEDSILDQVHIFIDRIIKRENCTQVELAQRLGVTPQYLSSIKNGTNIPGFQTFNFLKVLAVDEKAFALASPLAKLIA